MSYANAWAATIFQGLGLLILLVWLVKPTPELSYRHRKYDMTAPIMRVETAILDGNRDTLCLIGATLLVGGTLVRLGGRILERLQPPDDGKPKPAAPQTSLRAPLVEPPPAAKPKRASLDGSNLNDPLGG